MPRKRTGANILPWLSANSDGREGRFIQIGNSFLLSPQVKQLSSGALRLYFCMAMESGGKRQFMFPRSAAKKYGIPVSSFERYTKELRSVGLIELMKNDCLMQFAPNTYRFCMSWKAEVAPQFEGRK